MSLLLLVESQRMFIHKLKKQVQEYFVGFLLLLLLNWDNAPSHPQNSQERDIWKTLWTWEQELKPRICHFRFLLEIFWVLSSCVSLSLSRGHLRIKSCPYHFPWLWCMSQWDDPLSQARSPYSVCSRQKEDSPPLSSWHLPPTSAPLALAMGHSNWKEY